jgi:hypothetical protein
MDICKNNYNGQYFIFIQYIGIDKILLVTPTGEIKALEKKHFSETIDTDEYIILLKQQITKAQYEAYTTYKKNRDDELVEGFLFQFEQLAPWEQQAVLRHIMPQENA